jgi:hypothetical protein
MAWTGTVLLLQRTQPKFELGNYKTHILNVATALTCSAKGKMDLRKTGGRLVFLQKKGVNEWTPNQATSYFLAYNTQLESVGRRLDRQIQLIKNI